MGDDGNYIVTYQDGSWHVRSPRGVSETRATQQAAIDAAKSKAFREKVDVIWMDREGTRQGHARFRSPAPDRRHLLRSLLLR